MLDRQALNSALKPTADCLSPEQLEKLASGQTQSTPHLAACPRCQAELAMLKSFESATQLPDEGAAVAWISSQLERRLQQIKNPARSSEAKSVSWLVRVFTGGRIRLAIPLAAVIAIAAVIVLLRPAKEPPLQAQLEQGQAIMRSQEIETLRPSGESAQAPRALEWKAFPGAAKYKVEVMEVDRFPIWETQTNDNSVTIPDSVRTRMLPAKPILWRVTASDPQGRVIATSQVQRFFVSRPKK
jgi:hypothetical protein